MVDNTRQCGFCWSRDRARFVTADGGSQQHRLVVSIIKTSDVSIYTCHGKTVTMYKMDDAVCVFTAYILADTSRRISRTIHTIVNTR